MLGRLRCLWIMLGTPASSPCLWSLVVAINAHPEYRGMSNPTFRFFILWFLMRRVNHSFDVCPVIYLSRAPTVAATLATTRALWPVSAFRSTLSPGRIKYTWDQRVCLACSPGGELSKASQHVATERQKTDLAKGNPHNAMHIRSQDAATENGHGISNVADGVSRERLDVLPFIRTRDEDLQPAEAVVQERLREMLAGAYFKWWMC